MAEKTSDLDRQSCGKAVLAAISKDPAKDAFTEALLQGKIRTVGECLAASTFALTPATLSLVEGACADMGRNVRIFG